MTDDVSASGARRSSACLVLPLSKIGTQVPEWSDGPLELTYNGGGRQVLTTAETRQTYFQNRVVSALYERRWHRFVDVPLLSSRAWATELILVPASLGPVGLLVIHVDLGCSAAGDLERLTRFAVAENSLAELAALLPAGWAVDESARRAWTVAHATFAECTPPLDPSVSWTPTEQWLWVLATATQFASFPPTGSEFATSGGHRPLSRDWDMLALRDGLAFVGRTPDDGGQNFHATAATLVHTVYLDVFVLTRLQLLVLNGLANDLALPGHTHLDRTPLHSLQFRLAMFRKILWWQSVSVYGRANELLELIQQAARLPELMSQVVSDLTEVTTFAEAVAGRRTNALLALLTVVGLPYGVSFAGVITWATPGPAVFGVAMAIATTLAISLVVAIPSARELLRELFTPGDRP